MSANCTSSSTDSVTTQTL